MNKKKIMNIDQLKKHLELVDHSIKDAKERKRDFELIRELEELLSVKYVNNAYLEEHIRKKSLSIEKLKDLRDHIIKSSFYHQELFQASRDTQTLLLNKNLHLTPS